MTAAEIIAEIRAAVFRRMDRFATAFQQKAASMGNYVHQVLVADWCDCFIQVLDERQAK